MSHAYQRVRRGTITLAALLALTAGQGYAQWTQGPSITTARVLAQQAYANGKIYLAGGSTASAEIGFGSYPINSATSASILNAPGGSSWTAASALTLGRVGGFAGTVNGKIYIVGGHSSVTSSAFNFASNTLEYDPVNNTYSEKAGPIVPVTGAAGAVVGSKIYLIGGLSLNDQSQLVYGNWVQEYDPANNSWSVLSTVAPYSSFYAAAVGNGQNIYLIGGSVGSNVVKTAYKGALAGGGITWTAIKDYPVPVASAAAGVLNTKVYVAGGEGATGAINKVYRYDDAGNKWDAWYALPAVGSNVNSLVNDGASLYFVGGSNSKNVYKLTDGANVSVAAVDQTDFYITTKTGTTKNIQLHVANNGVAPLEGGVNIAPDAQGWVSTSNGTFSGIAAGSAATLNIQVGDAAATQGNYKTTVTVTTNDAAHSQIMVNIHLYVRDQIAVQPTKVVIEEGTGTWCGYCPDGHRVLAAIEDQYGDQVIAMAYHGYTGTDDPYITGPGESVINKLNIQGYPNASIQRWFFPNEPFQMTNRGVWATYTGTVLATQPNAPMALNILKYKYDPTTKMVTAKIQVTSAVAIAMTSQTKFRINAMLLQDSINHKQTEYTATGTIYNDPYYQRHLVRGVFPDENGQEMQVPDGGSEDGVLLPGTTFTEDITFSADATTDVPRSAVVFVVHRTELGNTLQEVYQGQEIPLNSSISANSYTVNTATSSASVTTKDTASFETVVKNNGTAPVQVTITRTVNQLPSSGWNSWFCLGDNCTTGGQTSIGPITVAPGETKNVEVHINGASAGTGKVTLHFEDTDGNAYDQQYTATVAQGAGVDYPVAGASGLRLSQNMPNPASSVTTFNYALPSAAVVTVDVFNISGEKILGMNEGRLEAGSHDFDVNVSALPSGTYSVRVNANGTVVSRLFTVAR